MKIAAAITVSRRPRTDNEEQLASMITANTMQMGLKSFTQAVKDLNKAGMVIGETAVTVKANQFEIQSTTGDTNLAADSDGNLQVKANVTAAAFNVAAPTTAQGTSFINKFLVDSSLAMCITTWGAVLDNKAVIGTTDKIALGTSDDDRATPVFLIRQGSRFFVLNPLLFSEGVLFYSYDSIGTQSYDGISGLLTRSKLYYSRVKDGEPGFDSNNPLYSDTELKNKATFNELKLDIDETSFLGYTVKTMDAYNFVDGHVTTIPVYNIKDGIFCNYHDVYAVEHYNTWNYSSTKGYVSSNVVNTKKATSVTMGNVMVLFNGNLPYWDYDTMRISDSDVRTRVRGYLSDLQMNARDCNKFNLRSLADAIYTPCFNIVNLQHQLLYYCRLYAIVDDNVEMVVPVVNGYYDMSALEDFGTGTMCLRFFPRDYDKEVDINDYENSDTEAEWEYSVILTNPYS